MTTIGSADASRNNATSNFVIGTVDPAGLYLKLVDLLREYGAQVMHDSAEKWDDDATIKDFIRYELSAYSDDDLMRELKQRQTLEGLSDDDIYSELSARGVSHVERLAIITDDLK